MNTSILRTELPVGVELTPLEPHRDERGSFTELFRRSWTKDVDPVQWNAVRSELGVLRGVHVHPRHNDYLIVYAGRTSVGLHDLRSQSETQGTAALLELSGDEPTAITIPHGVAHGFLFHEPSIHIYAVSHYWDPADELGCLWSDPDLGIDWPAEPVKLSKRDAELQSLAELRRELEPYQPI